MLGLMFQQIFTPEIYVGGSVISSGIRLVRTAALTIHVTALVLLKGVLFARSSRLVADKFLLGFRFP